MILNALDLVEEFKDGIENKRQFAPLLGYREYKQGEVLFENGEVPTFFYLLLEG